MTSCQLCSSKQVRQIETKIRNVSSGKIKVYGCGNCGVQFLFPQTTDEELISYYSNEYRKEYTDKNFYSTNVMDEFFRRSLPEAQARVERVKGYLSEDDRVLEVGCASGYFLATISPWVRSVCGTEWDEQNAAYCRSKGFEVKSNIEEFPHKFDKIFMFHVLEHIPKPIDFLQKLKDHLTPNGMLFVEVPNNDDVLLTTYGIQEFRDFYYQSAHLWYFNDHSLSYTISGAGFKPSILPLQRYDISNHVHWLKERAPGGQGKYTNVFSVGCNEEYTKGLVAAKKTDTIFAICTVE